MGVDASSQGEADMAFEADRGALAGARSVQSSMLQSQTRSKPWASIVDIPWSRTSPPRSWKGVGREAGSAPPTSWTWPEGLATPSGSALTESSKSPDIRSVHLLPPAQYRRQRAEAPRR